MPKNEKNCKAGNKSTRTATPAGAKSALSAAQSEAANYKFLYEICRECYELQKELRAGDRAAFESLKRLYDLKNSQADRLQDEINVLRDNRNSIVELALKQL